MMQYSQDQPPIHPSEDYMSTSSIGSGRDSSSSSSAAVSSPFFYSDRCSIPLSGENSPCNMSPWHHSIPADLIGGDPSGWSMTSIPGPVRDEIGAGTFLIGSLVREEGRICSLAAAGPLLYTGSDSKNIRVWKNQKEYAAFKSSSGLVKAIVIANGDRILTGHKDGKIRVWQISPKDPTLYKRIGSLPRLKDMFKYSFKPSNYVEVRRHRSALWIRHCDPVSCLSFCAEHGLLYSGSWDRTFKIWRIADSKCLESVVAHEDAVNSVVAAAFDAVVLTGSADGTVKLWRREMYGKETKHRAIQTLLKQDSAVTALIISAAAPVAYSASSDGVINFWEWERERKMLSHGGVLRGHKLAVLCLAAAGSLMLSGSADKTICVWRREGTGVHSCLSVLTGHSEPVKCLSIEEDEDDEEGNELNRCAGGRRFILYSGSLDRSVKFWRVSEQQHEALMRGPPHVQ